MQQKATTQVQEAMLYVKSRFKKKESRNAVNFF